MKHSTFKNKLFKEIHEEKWDSLCDYYWSKIEENWEDKTFLKFWLNFLKFQLASIIYESYFPENIKLGNRISDEFIVKFEKHTKEIKN